MREILICANVVNDNNGNVLTCPVAGNYLIKGIATTNPGYVVGGNGNLVFNIPQQYMSSAINLYMQQCETTFIYLPCGYQQAGGEILFDVSVEVVFAFNFILIEND